jgi:hypothetical protein
MSRRFRLSSTAWNSALRERPPVFGARFQGRKALVATTISSRWANSGSSFPITSSDAPIEYMLAVSKKLIPASMASRMKGRDWS